MMDSTNSPVIYQKEIVDGLLGNESFDKDISFIQFFNVILDLFEFALVVLFTSLQPSRIDKAQMSHLLILVVDLIPLPLETLTNFLDFLTT